MAYYKKISSFFFTLCIVAGSSLFTHIAEATLVDGLTPANEGVCDPLVSATKGLYGLCVAYCEAQDLDVIGDKETPNNKILANYRKKMQAGDPDMPCLKAECPCWTAAEFSSVITNTVSSTSCTISSTVAMIRNVAPTQIVVAAPEVPLCRFTDTGSSPIISRRFSGEEAIPAINAQSCYKQIVDVCSTLPTL